MTGRKIGHYRIERRLGAGGMGEVYLAQDLALGRPTALKILPEGVGPDLRERLRREAEAASRLQHPGIATFHEAGEDGDVTFVAMEFVDGVTLRRRLQDGPLSVDDARSVASGLLEALVHAHAAGVVHRDIKPENVMIVGERMPKLLDFGLASGLDVPPSSSGDTPDETPTRTVLTAVGAVLGSPGYMSPEQFSGGPVDARSDLFAVGAVLYEMLSGTAAFPGSTTNARIAATLTREPPPLAGAASALEPVVRRALARDPERRYPTASAFLRELASSTEGRSAATYPDTLAIVDFVNRTRRPEDDWIGAALADSLAAELGGRGGVGIVPRARIAREAAASGAHADPLTIAKRIGCRWVLHGGVQRSGDALRVVVELAEVPTESVVASEKVDGAIGDLFSIQDRLGEAAARALALRPRENEPRAPAAVGAYEYYARGWRRWMSMTKGGFDDARELFEQAIAQEPAYADALAGLTAVHDMRFTFMTDPAELDLAIGYARRAIAADPDHAAAHVWLGYAVWRRHRPEEALAILRRAAELAPGEGYAPYFAACVLLELRRPAEAIPEYQRCVERIPGFGFAWVGLGSAHFEAGNDAEAVWTLRRGVELEAKAMHATAGAGGMLGECLRCLGRLEEARASCLQGLDAVERTDHMYRDTFRAICLNTLGRVALGQRDLEGARSAFRQCELHLRGRRRTLGGGYLLCQALAGRAGAEADAALLDEARHRYRERSEYDWSWLWTCDAATTERDLGVKSSPNVDPENRIDLR